MVNAREPQGLPCCLWAYAMPLDENDVPSPCTRVCTLDDDNVCIGCKRTVDEIKAWRGLSPDAKRALLRKIETRS